MRSAFRQIRANMLLRRLRTGAFAFLACSALLFADPAQIVFTGGAGGTVSYAGGAAPLVGTDIVLDTIAGVGTSHPGDHSLSAVLNFTTGAFDAANSTAGRYVFDAGGSFKITAGSGATDSDLATLAASPDPFLSGINVIAIFDPLAKPGQTFISLTLDFGFDRKNPLLLSYFGLPVDTPFIFGAGIAADPALPGTGPHAFSKDVLASKVVNTVVPEPRYVLLFSGALIFLAGSRYRKERRRQETAR